MNKKSIKFSPEVKERAMRMVQEYRGEYSSQWAAVESTALKIGCVPQTLLTVNSRPALSPAFAHRRIAAPGRCRLPAVKNAFTEAKYQAKGINSE